MQESEEEKEEVARTVELMIKPVTVRLWCAGDGGAAGVAPQVGRAAEAAEVLQGLSEGGEGAVQVTPEPGVVILPLNRHI